MLRLGKDSQQNPEEVLEEAASFFGSDGLGLALMQSEDGSLIFEGGGGFVVVRARPQGKGSTVDIETREFELDARRFLEHI